MTTYLARKDLRTIKLVMTIPFMLLTLVLALLIVEANQANQELPIALGIACLIGMALGAANILSFHRQQRAWLELDEQGLRYGHGEQQPNELRFEDIISLSASPSGHKLELITEQSGATTIHLVFERSDELIRQLSDALSSHRCTLDIASLETAQQALASSGQLPSLTRVLTAATFGSAVMIGIYALFTQLVPYLI